MSVTTLIKTCLVKYKFTVTGPQVYQLSEVLHSLCKELDFDGEIMVANRIDDD